MKSVTATAYRTHLIRSAIFGALALSLGTVSFAADLGETRQLVVKYGDLNLAIFFESSGHHRHLACFPPDVCNALYEDTRDPGIKSSVDACVQKAIQDAVVTVGRPELSAVYAAKTHRPAPVFVAATKAH